MTIDNAQLTADRDRLFADWGKSATFRKVTQSFSPQTQQISETETTATLLAIVGAGTASSIPEAGGQAQAVDLVLQVKAEEWTGTSGDVSWQVDVRGVRYEIIQQVESGDQQLIELLCRKVA